MKDFRDLQVWEKGHDLALDCYRSTELFPEQELYGLISQIRRCAASIPANIAEGCGRSNDGDFARFLQNAMGSASELEYHFLLSRDLNLMDCETHAKLDKQVNELKRMLVALSRKVEIERHQR